jgi:hypothetical protein
MRSPSRPGERTPPTFVRVMMRVGTVLVFIGLLVGLLTVVGGVVNLVRGEFKMAFAQLVFGVGICSVLGYSEWYMRNGTRKRNDDRVE